MPIRFPLRQSGKGKVFLAVTEDGLSRKSRDGENNGRTLHHAGVVRELRPSVRCRTERTKARSMCR